VVALSVAGNFNFEDSQAFLAYHGRKLNRGFAYLKAYMEIFKLKQVELRDRDYRNITYTKALDKYNLLLEGTWLVTTTTHISCIKDGKIEDWMKYGDQDRVCSIYRVEGIKKDLPKDKIKIGKEIIEKKKAELKKPAKRYTKSWKDCSYYGEKGVYQYIVTVTTWDKRKKRLTIWKDYSNVIEETPRSWEYGSGTQYQVEKFEYKLNPHYIEDED
tara:strand:- start:3036 stop:3680 length:645 start_codon:yes stop_codon:yes gene_type:complete